jgi:hypothetical protein
MSEKQEMINEILGDWKKYYEVIGNLGLGDQAYPPMEFKDITQYLNNCFNRAVLELLEIDLIKNLRNELSHLMAYVQDKRYGYRFSEILDRHVVAAIKIDAKAQYLEKLNSIKDIFLGIERIDLYVDIYGKADEVIELALRKYKQKFDEQIADLIGETSEVHLHSEYKKQADEVSERIKRNIWILIFLFALIPTTHIIISAMLMPKLGMDNESISAYLVKLLFTIPLVWVILFTIRYIKEDRKIEQTYRHKEMVARTYLNFLDMLSKNPRLDDGTARRILSRIAIESMGLNPALLLDKSTSEKIPMEELLTRMMDRALGNSDGVSQQKQSTSTVN